MFKKISEFSQMKYQKFIYNYKWSDYTHILNGPISKLAFTIPIFGYLILFNDYVAENINFLKLTNETDLLLTPSDRLRFIYFGLVFLAVSNSIYYLKRPWILKYGRTESEFIDYGLTYFTSEEYLQFHQDTRKGHLTRKGKYYDSEWDGFWDLAVGHEV